MSLGSGRPVFWLHDILVIAERPIDQKLAGAGIGNRAGIGAAEDLVYGHNDWLEMATQTGLIGFALFAMLQVLLLKAILRISGKERYGFLALFASVNVMMFVSNSYAWRIQVGHLYYMMLAYAELRETLKLQVEQLTMSGDRENSAAPEKFYRGTG
jgi:O-antigen ligase